VAVWLPFKVYKEKFFQALICSIKGKMYKLGMEASRRVKPIRDTNNKAHLEFSPSDHWYLQTLGINPPYQGKGYGTILMRYMLEKVDENPLPVFLETSTERNVRFYERLGFNVMKKYSVPGTDVTQ
jgi:ribosomal protein S18 acetylase RimI-like enzyme